MAEDPVARAVAATLATNAELAAAWRRGEPGAWGRLAGQAVLAYRRSQGRPLAEPERRHVWATLWAALEATR